MSERIELVRREFLVEAALDQAWQHLARVEAWPSWAHHIRSVKLVPAGPLTGQSEGRFHLRGGVRSAFQVTTFDPPRRWLWVGKLATVRVHYDHLFEPFDENLTRLTWIVAADGPASRTLGRLFAAIYGRNLDRAIPNLQAEYRALG